MFKMTDRADDMLVLMLANGTRLKIMRHEFHGFLTLSQCLISLAAVLGIAIAADRYVFHEPIDIVGRSIYWALGISLYLLAMVCPSWHKRVGAPIGLWGALLADNGHSDGNCRNDKRGLSGGVLHDAVETRFDLEPAAFIRDCLLAQALDFVMGDHLMRHRQGKMRDADIDGQVASLFANGQSIFVNHISTLEANQHSVEITIKSGKFVVHRTLKALLAQIPEAAGLQVHRSYRVSRNAIIQLSGKLGEKMLLLSDGRSVSVSRPRESDLDTWFREQVGLQKA